jgi:hypothetical protein
MTLLAAGCSSRVPLRENQRIGRALRSTWLELLAERYLLRTQALLSMDCGPTRSGMAAAQELLIDAFMARPAVRRVYTPDSTADRYFGEAQLDHSIGRVRNCGNEPFLVPRSFCYLSIGNVRHLPIRLSRQSVRVGISPVCPNEPAAEQAACALNRWLGKNSEHRLPFARGPVVEEREFKPTSSSPRSSRWYWGWSAGTWPSGCGHLCTCPHRSTVRNV